MSSTAIGIDLGTTYSCVAIWENGRVEIIANDQGNRTTPSMVAFDEAQRMIGEGAKNQIGFNPKNTVFDAKRLIGREFSDIKVQEDLKHWPFKVINKNGTPKIEVVYKGDTKQFTPQEISSMVLVKMKETAEAYMGKTVTDAVITVPAYFNDLQRQATKDAGTIAGLNVIKIINEPTAAGLAYGLNKSSSLAKNVLIYDLGGGTFDVSVLSIKDQLFEVKATSGDTHLGGEDFTNRLVNHYVEEFNKKHKKDIKSNPRAFARLRNACEGVKRTLSSQPQSHIQIDYLFEGIDFYSSISRALFDDLCLDLFKSTLQTIDKVLKDSDMKKCDIDEIILVGGSTRIPKIQKLITEYFNGKEPSKTINPDEAVAYGAAVQAAMLTMNAPDIIKSVVLVDVTSLSLGINVEGGFMANVISSNTPIPTQKSRTFTTPSDFQTTILFKVFQGENLKNDKNLFIDKFELHDILPKPKGQPKVEVMFKIDANGILSVSATDQETYNSKSITISPNNYRLNASEIAKFTKEAEQFKQEDKQRTEKINEKAEFEAYLYELKSILNNDKFIKQCNEKRLSKAQKVINRAFYWLKSDQNVKNRRYSGYLFDIKLGTQHIREEYRKFSADSKL